MNGKMVFSEIFFQNAIFPYEAIRPNEKFKLTPCARTMVTICFHNGLLISYDLQ